MVKLCSVERCVWPAWTQVSHGVTEFDISLISFAGFRGEAKLCGVQCSACFSHLWGCLFSVTKESWMRHHVRPANLSLVCRAMGINAFDL